jgi:hypothetical protein
VQRWQAYQTSAESFGIGFASEEFSGLDVQLMPAGLSRNKLRQESTFLCQQKLLF